MNKSSIYSNFDSFSNCFVWKIVVSFENCCFIKKSFSTNLIKIVFEISRTMLNFLRDCKLNMYFLKSITKILAQIVLRILDEKWEFCKELLQHAQWNLLHCSRLKTSHLHSAACEWFEICQQCSSSCACENWDFRLYCFLKLLFVVFYRRIKRFLSFCVSSVECDDSMYVKTLYLNNDWLKRFELWIKIKHFVNLAWRSTKN